MSLIDYAFRDNARVLQLTCKVAAGWRSANKTYCYSEECRQIEVYQGMVARVRVSVFPVPVTLSNSASEFLIASAHEGGDFSTVSYSIDAEWLRVNVRLHKPDGNPNETLPWDLTNESRKLCLKWEDMFYDSRARYRISLMAVFSPPPNAPGPTVWEKGEGFFPGGLPSLGKRR